MLNFINTNHVFVIAEVSSNHGQDFNNAMNMIKEAKKCGADAVKFQAYTPEMMTLNLNNKYFLQLNQIQDYDLLLENQLVLYVFLFHYHKSIHHVQQMKHDAYARHFRNLFDHDKQYQCIPPSRESQCITITWLYCEQQ